MNIFESQDFCLSEISILANEIANVVLEVRLLLDIVSQEMWSVPSGTLTSFELSDKSLNCAASRIPQLKRCFDRISFLEGEVKKVHPPSKKFGILLDCILTDTSGCRATLLSCAKGLSLLCRSSITELQSGVELLEAADKGFQITRNTSDLVSHLVINISNGYIKMASEIEPKDGNRK